jgi:serine/threonine protein kinase
MYNTFRIGIVCEYIDHKLNLEYIYRKRKQVTAYWKQEELEKMIVSLISTLSHMQTVGLCHRDLKPANLFVMPTGEVKVIDFGESKDYFREGDDGGDPATATIRGTPQYLSPILWKAHVVDGNSRFAKHNIFKSDVFSIGLMFFQLASMEDVTGYN